MSPFPAVRVRDHAKHGLLLEDRHGAGDEGTGSHIASLGKEDHVVASGRDHWDQRSGRCDAGGNATKSSVTTGCLTGGGASPAPGLVAMLHGQQFLGLGRGCFASSFWPLPVNLSLSRRLQVTEITRLGSIVVIAYRRRVWARLYLSGPRGGILLHDVRIQINSAAPISFI